jgi:hypothetical protein
MNPLRWNVLWWSIGSAMVAVILWGTLAPGREVPNLHVNDKIEHFTAHFGVALWFSGLIRRDRYLWLALAVCALGGGIELAQGAMGLGRDADWHDFYADSLGVGAALALAWAGLGGWAMWLERLLLAPKSL